MFGHFPNVPLCGKACLCALFCLAGGIPESCLQVDARDAAEALETGRVLSEALLGKGKTVGESLCGSHPPSSMLLLLLAASTYDGQVTRLPQL